LQRRYRGWRQHQLGRRLSTMCPFRLEPCRLPTMGLGSNSISTPRPTNRTGIGDMGIMDRMSLRRSRFPRLRKTRRLHRTSIILLLGEGRGRHEGGQVVGELTVVR
jgi:hypothetical protein